MLNKNNERELAYVVRVNDVKPIIGRDRVECAVVNGWTIMVRKDVFKPGSLGIYFEIDSKTPETEPFEFLEAKKYKIKTQKYGLKDENGKKAGQFWSQGLLMPASDFGGFEYTDGDGQTYLHFDKTSYFKKNVDYKEGDFLTKALGVTYADTEDNARKAKVNPDAKINAALARHPKIAKKYGKMIKKNRVLRTLFILLFGKAKDVRHWPAWVKKTDEERVQNMPWILQNKEPWVATEKIDGTSTTFTMKRVKGLIPSADFFICSRNVCFDTPKKMANGAWYDTNVYQEMAIKYDVENVLKDILNNDSTLDFITLQGETYGEGIQKRDYSLKGHDFAAFNVIFGHKDGSVRRLNPIEMTEFLTTYKIPCVPIVNKNLILPDTVEELLNYATDNSMIDGGMREGLVFRSLDGSQSFKAVSNEFLARYHG